ncbi:hypothetical protein Pse7367_0709 [Thalassoporum mexicanum PCC 7367]|uniref:hypothetical protein n=1 Tax=Thalassoporum mexicanum TaxID=3457544 RepID=UPI00029FFB72|nr:hypothetical protein [Pseudanabaena sp. PCC 7367]AFY69011.1 hypothetical protein Pse7367_0709 [Pseudanabaena sp. PCC 7367]
MAIIVLKAWYVPEYEPLSALIQRPYDLRLAKNSLLKSALRADFLDESNVVSKTEWFQRYLAGEAIEFYIEGSGSYVIANIDLISHEIYFTKRDILSSLDPTLFFSYQLEQPGSSEVIREALEQVMDGINQKSRIPLKLEQSFRLSDEPIKLKSSLMSRLKRSLLYIADTTPIAYTAAEPSLPLLSPMVCVEVGYALQAKSHEQIMLIQLGDQGSPFPFDLPMHQRLIVKDKKDLVKQLPGAIAKHLKRFNLF